MPLDATSGFNPSGSQGNQALIVATEEIALHEYGNCIFGAWIAGVHQVFARKLEILPDQIYFTSALEVTTGQLEIYKGKTLLMGCSVQIENTMRMTPDNDCRSAYRNVMRSVSQGFIAPLGRYRFPDTLQKMAEQGKTFDASIMTYEGGRAAFGCYDTIPDSAMRSNILKVVGDGLYRNPRVEPH
jgi:hypothetical protein